MCGWVLTELGAYWKTLARPHCGSVPKVGIAPFLCLIFSKFEATAHKSPDHQVWGRLSESLTDRPYQPCIVLLITQNYDMQYS